MLAMRPPPPARGSFGYTSDVLRRVFTLASAVSLLSILAMVCFWARSYSTQDCMNFRWSTGEATLGTSRGGFCLAAGFRAKPVREAGLTFKVGTTGWPDDPETDNVHYDLVQAGAWREWGGFVLVNFKQPSGTRVVFLVIPYSFGFALASPLPILWLVLRYGRRRSVAGTCPSCGYDLTGNTSGICPECAAAVVRSAGANSQSP